jgi:predicted RNA-binding Zn ribbon-like protein
VEFRTGYGAAWLDFLATRLGRYIRSEPTELLADPAALRRWLAEHDLVPAGPISSDDVSRAQALRESLHGLASATVAGRRVARADVHLVTAVLAADRPPQLRPAPEGLRAQRPADIAQALGRLARQAVDQLVGPDRARLQACGDDTCSGIFLDDTGRRRWCADGRCGVKARVRAHRVRQKA